MVSFVCLAYPQLNIFAMQFFFGLHVDNKYRLLHFPMLCFDNLSVEQLISVKNSNSNENQCRFFFKLLIFSIFSWNKRWTDEDRHVTALNMSCQTFDIRSNLVAIRNCFASARHEKRMPMTGQRLWINDVQIQFRPLCRLIHSFRSALRTNDMNHIAWVWHFQENYWNRITKRKEKKKSHNQSTNAQACKPFKPKCIWNVIITQTIHNSDETKSIRVERQVLSSECW